MARRLAEDDNTYARGWKKQDRAVKRAFLLGYSHRLGCEDCGEKDARVLQFDHRDRSTKILPVSHLVSFNYSFDKIIAEIEKCDVRCANCHTLRTGDQLGWYQGFQKWLH